jgi:hypothetical protein
VRSILGIEQQIMGCPIETLDKEGAASHTVAGAGVVTASAVYRVDS